MYRSIFTSMILASALLASVSVSRAASLDDVLLLDNGQPLQDCVKIDANDKTKCAQSVDLTARMALARLVDNRYQGEETMKLSEIVARGRLAEKLRAVVSGELSPEEISLIKTLLPKAGQAARVTLQLCVTIDPKCS